MPLVRKLLIFAAVDGLVLQPRSHPHAQQQQQQQAIKIDYKGNVGPLLKDEHDDDKTISSFESHGVVGMSLCMLWKMRVTDTYKGSSK